MKKITLLLGLLFTCFVLSQTASAQTNAAYDNNMIEVETGVWAIYSGDVDQDGFVDILDYLLVDADVQAGLEGYLPTDLTGDGFVDIFDYLLVDKNVQAGIFSSRPF